MRLNKKRISVTILYMFLSIITYSIFLNTQQNLSLDTDKMFAILVVFQFLLTLIVFSLAQIKLHSMTAIFVCLNYIFHLSHPAIKLFAPDYQLKFDIAKYIPSDIYIQTMKFTLLCMIFLVAGALFKKSLINSKIRKTIDYSERVSTEYLSYLNKMGWLIFATTFPIELYIQVNRVLISLKEGYLATFENEISGLAGFMSNFCLVGFLLILIGTQNNKKKNLTYVILYTVIYCLFMISGVRMWHLLKLVIVYSYFVYLYKIKISFKNIVLILIILYFGAGFLSVIADIRAYDFTNEGEVVQVINNIFINNPFIEALDEFGSTIYTTALTVQKIPNEINVSWGKQYLFNFLTIFPGFFKFVQKALEESNYVLLLKMPTIGGSYVGEAFYSFASGGIAFSFIVGVFIQWLTDKVEYGIKTCNYKFIAYTALFQYSFIAWVRGSSGFMYRNTIFSFLFLYIFSVIAKKIVITKSKRGMQEWKVF